MAEIFWKYYFNNNNKNNENNQSKQEIAQSIANEINNYFAFMSHLSEFDKSLHDRLRQYALDNSNIRLKVENVHAQIRNELLSIEEGNLEIQKMLETLNTIRKKGTKNSRSSSKSSTKPDFSKFGLPMNINTQLEKRIVEIIVNTQEYIKEYVRTDLLAVPGASLSRHRRLSLLEKIVCLLDLERASIIAVRALMDDVSFREARKFRIDDEIDASRKNFEPNMQKKKKSKEKNEITTTNNTSDSINTATTTQIDGFDDMSDGLVEDSEEAPLITDLGEYYTFVLGTAVGIGKALEVDLFFQNKMHSGELDFLVNSPLKLPKPEDHIKRIKLAREMGLKIGDKWDNKTSVKLGAFMLQAMIKSNPYVFAHHNIRIRTQSYGVLQLIDNDLISIMNKRSRYIPPKTIHPIARPMLCPPRNWKNISEGPFFYYNEPLMRFDDYTVQNEILRTALYGQTDTNSDIGKLLECLNVVQSVPWTINKDVLDVLEHVYRNEAGGVAKLPTLEDKPYPPESDFDSKPNKAWLYKAACAAVDKENRENRSLRCDIELKLDLARELTKADEIYFPVNMDFRGRVYPIPPHVNLIGNDIVRSLMKFKHKKPLGEVGWFWLRVHMANRFGYDKESNEKRCEWTDKHLERISKCAQNPYEDRWWLTAPDSWQSLGCIFEIAQALKSGNPHTYETGYAVSQDGSCNGLQHYAAMLRDEKMAEYVNVAARDTRGDVYMAVTKLVINMVNTDANNPKSPNHNLAKLLAGCITRKLLKQSVMTSVYGVTTYGVKKQLLNWLGDPSVTNGIEVLKILPHPIQKNLVDCAIYLARCTINAIGQTNTPAWLSMLWLKDCAKKIATKGHRVNWLTPLNLPCTQPYASAFTSVTTPLQNITLHTHEGSPNILKQASAFPPNFVHSLDSTHCLMTAREMNRRGLEFASIHDSFWTHAADVDILNTVLREQFIELHSKPLLQQLYESFVSQYPDIDFAPPPKPSTFDLESVRNSRYFFS